MSPFSKKRTPDKAKSSDQPKRCLPEDADPALLAWAREKEMVQPGQDGTFPAMDKWGFGIQSMVSGGPMQTGEGSGAGKTGKTHGWGSAGKSGYGGPGRSEMRDGRYGDVKLLNDHRPVDGEGSHGVGDLKSTGLDRCEPNKLDRLKSTFHIGRR